MKGVYKMDNFSQPKYEIHDAVWYKDHIARIEDSGVDANNKRLYLIQTANHYYYYVYEEDLEVYIG